MKKFLVIPILFSFCFLGNAQKKGEKTKNEHVIYFFDATTTDKIVSAEKLDFKKVKYQSNLFGYFERLKKSEKEFLVLTNSKGQVELGMTLTPIEKQSASEDCGISCYYEIEGCQDVGCFLDAETCICTCTCVDEGVGQAIISDPRL